MKKFEMNVLSGDWSAVQAAYAVRAAIEAGELSVESAYEDVDVAPGAPLTDDGRAVVWVAGRSVALSKSEHDRRLQEALRAASSTTTSPESLGPLCPVCQEPTNRTVVCPKCAIGRAGLKYQYACTCGITFYTREAM